MAHALAAMLQTARRCWLMAALPAILPREASEEGRTTTAATSSCFVGRSFFGRVLLDFMLGSMSSKR